VVSHIFDPSILREYDIRGVVGTTLGVDDARAVGAAFGTRIVEAGGSTVALGRDGRLTSSDLQAAMADGLKSCGLQVQLIGVGPTPMLYFSEKHLGADAGVMITGSHNPPDYNGFKLTLGGRSFFADRIQDLGALAASGEFAQGVGSIEEVEVEGAYVDGLLAECEGVPPMSLVWDCGNGAAGDVVKAITSRLPGNHTLLFEEIDGTFPNHHPDPTVEKNLVDLRREVAASGSVMGLGFDGDGDRIGVVDSTGRIVWADQLMLVYAEELLRRIPGATVVADVKSSQVLFDGIAAAGGIPLMCATGHSIIKDKMFEVGAPLAGEMSGHICFGDRYWGFDDAVYCAMRLIRIVAESGVTLSEIVDRLPKVLNTPELRFDCPEERKFEVVEEVRDRLIADGADIVEIDGVRVKVDGGWWLLRASNTQNVLVARCEADDAERLSTLKQEVARQVGLSGIQVPSELAS
jgi:phosphomannomutase